MHTPSHPQVQEGQINGIPVFGHIKMLGAPGKVTAIYGDIHTLSEADQAKLLALDHLTFEGMCCDGEGQMQNIVLPIQWASIQQEMLSFCGLVHSEERWILQRLRR